MRSIRTNPLLRRLALPALVLALAAGAAPAAFADDDDLAVTPEQRDQVVRALETKGYSGIHDVEIDDGRFEVDAMTADGHAVDLELDMQTLEVVHEKGD